MAMTLTEMRTLVRKLVDDVAQKRWDADGANTDVDEALGIAIPEAMSIAINAGSTRFRVTGVFSSTSSGGIDLATARPLKIHTVRLSSGASPNQVLDVIPPAGQAAYTGLHPYVETLSITYTPSPTVPTSGASTVTWGGGGDTPELDRLACFIAASHMKVIEGEENPVLERRKAELARAVATLPDSQSWVQVPSNGNVRRLWAARPFYWLLSGGNTMQLVER